MKTQNIPSVLLRQIKTHPTSNKVREMFLASRGFDPVEIVNNCAARGLLKFPLVAPWEPCEKTKGK